MFSNFMGTGAARVPAWAMPTACPRCLGPFTFLCKMVLQEYQHDNHGMIVTNMFQTSWTGAAKVPHILHVQEFHGNGCCKSTSMSHANRMSQMSRTWVFRVKWCCKSTSMTNMACCRFHGGGDRWTFFWRRPEVWTYQPQGCPPYHFHKKIQ